MALPDEKVSQNTVIVSIWFWYCNRLATDREVTQLTMVAHYGTMASSKSAGNSYEKSWCPREDSNLHSLARTSS